MYRTCQVVQRADVAVAAYWAAGRTGSQQARGRGANDHRGVAARTPMEKLATLYVRVLHHASPRRRPRNTWR